MRENTTLLLLGAVPMPGFIGTGLLIKVGSPQCLAVTGCSSGLSQAHFRFFDVNLVAMVAPSAYVFVTVRSLLGIGVTHIRPLWCGGGHQVPAPHYVTSVSVTSEGVLRGCFFLNVKSRASIF